MLRRSTSFIFRYFSDEVISQHVLAQKADELFQNRGRKFRIHKEKEGDKETFDNFEEFKQEVLNRQSKEQKVYKKKIDLEEEEKVQAEFLKAEKETLDSIKNYLKNDNLDLDPLNLEKIEKSKRMIRAMRLNSTFDYVREKDDTSLNAEYNNYSKFKNNYAYFEEAKLKDELDRGNYDTNRRLTHYVESLSPGSSHNMNVDIAKKAELKGSTVSVSLYEEAMEEMIEEDPELKDDEEVEEAFEAALNARLSPQAKEAIYNLYNEGWTVKDLSFKYGILPDRVKAVIWCKRYFYEEVAPNVDRTTWRLGLEKEFLYASKYPFQDYGIDINYMAALERGFQVVRMNETKNDQKPISRVFMNIVGKVKEIVPYVVDWYEIERKDILKGNKKYKLKDLVINKGSGRLDVSDLFKKIIWFSDERPNWLPTKALKKLDKGPRIASKGSRMGGKPQHFMPYELRRRKYW